jgi:hypothetical protein
MLTFSLLRSLADGAATYDDALARLSAAPLDAPSYFIIAGARPLEGAIVTRGRDATQSDVYPLGSRRWYVLETNYDHDKPPAQGDDRRHPGERRMEQLGRARAATRDGLLTVLSDTSCNKSAGERPLLNSITTYTAIMSAAAPAGDPASLRVVMRDPAGSDACRGG